MVDGKHVEITSPGQGSVYYSHTKHHSIILFALVDANYRFLFVDVGLNGRAVDAGVFRDSSLLTALENNSLNVPGPKPLPGRHQPVPHFIVGDHAFPLKTYLMKPYNFRTVKNNMNDERKKERHKQDIFDYRLSRACRLSENVFGILTNRFQVFRKPMPFSPEKATTVTLACIALHNWLTSKRDKLFFPVSLPDREDKITHEQIPGDWRIHPFYLWGLDMNSVNGSSVNACKVREELKEYVNKEGKISWQEQIVFGHRM